MVKLPKGLLFFGETREALVDFALDLDVLEAVSGDLVGGDLNGLPPAAPSGPCSGHAKHETSLPIWC